jgi:hypothetical protein
MIEVLALLAMNAWAAEPPKDEPEPAPVFEMSVHAVLAQTGRDAREAIEKPLRAAGGDEVLTGAERKVAFSFGRGTPAQLRERLLRGIDALAGVGPLKGEKETLNPPLAARKQQAAKERAALTKERAALAAALERAPQARAVIDRRLAALEAFDPSTEERRSVLVVYIEAAAGPR